MTISCGWREPEVARALVGAAGRIQRGDRILEGRFAVGDTAAERAASHVRTTTAVFKRTDVKNHVRALREQLTEDEKEQLTLRARDRADPAR